MTTLSPSWLALAVPNIEAVCSSEKSSSCNIRRKTGAMGEGCVVTSYGMTECVVTGCHLSWVDDNGHMHISGRRKLPELGHSVVLH